MKKDLEKNDEEVHINFNDTNLFERGEIKTLGTGESFGELSLIDYGNRTTATIITKTSCEFCCLNR